MMASLYVTVKITIDGDNSDAIALAYSTSKKAARETVYFVACRDAFGSSVPENCQIFDPVDDDGNRKQAPIGRFLMWDVDGDEASEMRDELSPVDLSITLYINDGKNGPRPITRYKSCGIDPSISERIEADKAEAEEKQDGSFKFALI